MKRYPTNRIRLFPDPPGLAPATLTPRYGEKNVIPATRTQPIRMMNRCFLFIDHPFLESTVVQVSEKAHASILNNSAAPVSRLEQERLYHGIWSLPRENRGLLGCGAGREWQACFRLTVHLYGVCLCVWDYFNI